MKYMSGDCDVSESSLSNGLQPGGFMAIALAAETGIMAIVLL